MKRFPFYKQYDAMQCGIACLRMLCKYYGKDINQGYLSTIYHATTEGVSLLGIKEVLGKLGFSVISGRLTLEQLSAATLPCILHLESESLCGIIQDKEKTKILYCRPRKRFDRLSH